MTVTRRTTVIVERWLMLATGSPVRELIDRVPELRPRVLVAEITETDVVDAPS